MSDAISPNLQGVPETLLIPLYAKGQPGNRLFFDPKAQDILNQVEYDFSRLRVPYKTVILVCQRAKKLDAVTRDFLAEHRRGTVLHLGCGFDSRFRRVDNGKVEWYDLREAPAFDLRASTAHPQDPGICVAITDGLPRRRESY